jgi:cell division protein FtsL
MIVKNTILVIAILIIATSFSISELMRKNYSFQKDIKIKQEQIKSQKIIIGNQNRTIDKLRKDIRKLKNDNK